METTRQSTPGAGARSTGKPDREEMMISTCLLEASR
jgi:hypothetical protein